MTISGGWNAADNCQTQLTLDPSQTVLDARYWGPVFAAGAIFDTFTGSLRISNLTFYRGESIGSYQCTGPDFPGHEFGVKSCLKKEP